MPKKSKANKSWLPYLIIGVVLGFAILFLAINKFPPNTADNGVYKLGACTFNGNRSCGVACPNWDGECTSEIENDCCTAIRECEGTTANPLSCYDKYCYEAGNKCIANLTDESDLQNLIYTCTCVDVESGDAC